MARLLGVSDTLVTGTTGDDIITVGPGTQPGTVKVTVVNGPVYDNLDGQVRVDGQGGSDTYTVTFGDLAVTVIIDDTGTDGTDTLTVNGTEEDDTLPKAAGFIKWRLTGDTFYRQFVFFDSMEGVTLNAADGNDTINDPNSGNFLILGGPGDDTITVSDTTGPVTVDGGDGSDTPLEPNRSRLRLRQLLLDQSLASRGPRTPKCVLIQTSSHPVMSGGLTTWERIAEMRSSNGLNFRKVLARVAVAVYAVSFLLPVHKSTGQAHPTPAWFAFMISLLGMRIEGQGFGFLAGWPTRRSGRDLSYWHAGYHVGHSDSAWQGPCWR